MEVKERILRLQGKVRHYAWGGYEYIPQLLGIDNAGHKPCAEYWMGAHSSASSVVSINEKKFDLHHLVEEDPTKYIGESVYKKFGELPYLLKILDVRDMLSIQVHPTKEEAAKGFEAEEAAGVPINAAHRNYKDKNHKPEVMVALSDFWLLHGFKQEAELKETLEIIDVFNFLLPVFEQQGYYGLYKEVMELPQQKVDEILRPIVEKAISKKEQDKSKPEHWVAKLYTQDQEIHNIDRGIFSIYFFNIVEVHKGEAVFQGAGIPHAYLEGQNVELMANSDNVLRGGLTPKHVDVPELLKHITFEAVRPNVMKGDVIGEHERIYPCPVEDFAISNIELGEGELYKHTSTSAEIYILIEGAIEIQTVNDTYKKGEAFYVLPATEITIKANNKAQIFKAFVP